MSSHHTMDTGPAGAGAGAGVPFGAVDAGSGLIRFMGMDFELGPNVLAPREETELLGNVCVEHVAQGVAEPVVIDMCCGSGNLGIAIARNIEGARVYACDLTPETVEVARRNVARFSLEDRVTVVQGDLFENIRHQGLEGMVDMVVCNPPYISSGRLTADRAHLLEHEPREAFDGGPYGIAIHQRLIYDALDFLRPGGALAFEFGEGQERQTLALVTRTTGYSSARFFFDASGVPRAALCVKR